MEAVEAREVIRSVRREWREKLGGVVEGRGGRLAEKAGVLLLDIRGLDERIEEAGGEENLVFMLCAQVAGGVTLGEWCRHYDLNRGLVWAFLTERDEWYQRYLRALEGVADGYVGEVVGIADDEEDVARGKLRVDARMKVAGMYSRKRFGDAKDGGAGGGGGQLPAVVQITFVDAVDGRAVDGRAVESRVIEG